jgi:hypothetical protein
MPRIPQVSLYEVSGSLPKGFQGHITYTTVLPIDLRELYVTFSFDKRSAAQDLEELYIGCRTSLAQNLPDGMELPEKLVSMLQGMPKTEINFSLFLDNACIGSAHKNKKVKEILIAPDDSSDGFVNCRPVGVLRIVLHVLNVLNDDTNYILNLKGGSE